MGSSLSIGLAELQTRANLARDYPDSFVALDGAVLWLESDGRARRLAILAQSDEPLLARFAGTLESFTPDYRLKLCSTDAANGAALRDVLPWLRPSPLGLTTSAGFGDRLGLATPGHVRALQHVLSHAPGRTIAPNFAQQSIREMERTGRTPVDVLTDATWGAFQAGWCGTLGADADHLKTPADIDATVAAGYSLYTLDPGEYVDDAANDAPRDILQEKLDALPWLGLESSPSDLQQRYVGKRIPLEHRDITLDGDAVVRAAVKYGSAVAHVSRMYRHIAAKGVAFELEVSVDETATPTSHQEHIYIARELQRLGVRWVSLAPRYVGRFEKGVDLIGSLEALREDLAGHAAIARVHVDGGMQEVTALESRYLYAVPDAMPDDVAVLAEPLTIAYHAVQRSAIEAGQVAVVFGAGPIGLLIAQLLMRARGCRALVIDIDDQRLGVAQELGATPLRGDEDTLVRTVEVVTGGEMADVVFEATGIAACTRMTTALVAHAGRIVLIGWNKGPVEVDTVTLMRKEVDLRGSRNSLNAFPAVLRLLADGLIDTAALITHRFGLIEAGAALDVLDKGQDNALKILIEAQ